VCESITIPGNIDIFEREPFLISAMHGDHMLFADYMVNFVVSFLAVALFGYFELKW
jgi:hypothetical protein